MLKRRFKAAIDRLGYRILPSDAVIEASDSSDMAADSSFVSLYSKCRPYTMTTASRMYALYKAIEYVERLGLPGDIVECGVWRGGSSMMAAYSLLALGSSARTLYLYDTYSGMSEPSDRDIDQSGRSARSLLEGASKEEMISAYAECREVRRNVLSTGYPADRLRFVEGKVEDTIPSVVPEQIALLRLDTDWYESTYHELQHLYPRLVANGVIIVDDYGHWKGTRYAVDTYMAEQGIAILLNRIDYTGRIGVKVAAPDSDESKAPFATRPPTRPLSH